MDLSGHGMLEPHSLAFKTILTTTSIKTWELGWLGNSKNNLDSWLFHGRPNELTDALESPRQPGRWLLPASVNEMSVCQRYPAPTQKFTMQLKPSLGVNTSILLWTYDFSHSFGANLRCKNQGTASFYPLPAVIYSSNLSRLDGICLYHQLMLHQALWPRNFSSSLARIDPRGSWFQHVSNLQLHQQHYEITMSIYHQIWTSMIWFHTFLERHFEIYHNYHLTFMGDHTNPPKLSRPSTWRYSNGVCLCNGERMFWSVGWFPHWFQVFQEHSISSLSPLYHHLPFTASVSTIWESCEFPNPPKSTATQLKSVEFVGGTRSHRSARCRPRRLTARRVPRIVATGNRSIEPTGNWTYNESSRFWKTFLQFTNTSPAFVSIEFAMQLLDFAQIVPNPITSSWAEPNVLAAARPILKSTSLKVFDPLKVIQGPKS